MNNLNITKYFTHLEERDGIFFCTQKDILTKFSEEEQDNLFEIEDTSWRFQYRAEVIAAVAQKSFDLNAWTFDCGGGNGYTALHMQNRDFNVVLLEPTLAACKNGKKRGLHKVICGTLDKETVKDNSIEQILLLDVLEHIADDAQFLRVIYEKMMPGGHLLLTVPAFQMLWSSEDKIAGHYRRYTIGKLKDLAIKAGFSIDYSTYFMEFLFLPILFVRVGMEKIGLLKPADKRSSSEKKSIAEKQFKERRGLTRFALDMLEHAEMSRLIKNKKVRFGSSIICVLRKE